MTNVGRHSGARHCEVMLSFGADSLALTVSDDGVGIGGSLGGAIAPQGGGGFGLFSLGSRIGLIGGTLDLVRIQEGGTRATIRIPWPSSASDGATDPAGRAASRGPGVPTLKPHGDLRR